MIAGTPFTAAGAEQEPLIWTVVVAWNNYGVTRSTGLSQIMKDENYAEPVSIPRSMVAEMKKSRDIYHITRSEQ